MRRRKKGGKYRIPKWPGVRSVLEPYFERIAACEAGGHKKPSVFGYDLARRRTHMQCSYCGTTYHRPITPAERENVLKEYAPMMITRTP